MGKSNGGRSEALSSISVESRIEGAPSHDELLRHAPVRKLVATVNRPVIDRGLSPSTRTHGQEGADRGYQLLIPGIVD